jgi:hypothetical protein
VELSAGIAPRFKTENRILVNGKETVEITYLNGWYKGLEHVQAHDETQLQWEYKGTLAEDAGYTEDEWWRVGDVEVISLHENGITLRVTLLSPGKCIEEGLEVTLEEWETFKLTRDKLRNGKESMERALEAQVI